jgi:hypothetical protein
LEAFDGAVAQLDLRTNADTERAAKIIIRLALGQENLDAAKLRDKASLRRERRAGCAAAGCFDDAIDAKAAGVTEIVTTAYYGRGARHDLILFHQTLAGPSRARASVTEIQGRD